MQELSGQRTKNCSFGCERLRKPFLPTHGENLFYTTLFRMMYFNKLIAGLSTLAGQLILG